MAQTNRIFIAKDPNIGTNNVTPIEDLSILVELEVERKSRSIVNSSSSGNDLQTSKNKSKKISFINGSTINGQQVLTTNYTNIGHDWKNNTTTLTSDSDDDLESLGITNIDISFNTSYAPQIVIDFIDIRGNAILEKGMSSKYNVFFSLPYPIFKLTVKGYYGQAVTYCLHLMKWNAKFNSHTGNFEIKTEFVGYTYAFLTDMLVGYLRAAVETPEGAKKLSEIKKKRPDVMSINELIKKINTFNEFVGKLNKTNDDIKQYTLIENDLSELNTIRGMFDSFIQTINDTNKPVNLNTQNNYAYHYNEALIGSLNDFNNNLKILTDSKSVINTSLNGIKLTINYGEGKNNLWYTSTVKDFINTPDKTTESVNVNADIVTEQSIISVDKILNDSKNYIQLASQTNSDSTLIIINFSDALTEIDRISNILINTKNDKMLKITSTLKNETNNDKLKLTINAIFEILSIHVDIFISLIRDVATKTISNTDRYNRFKIRGVEFTDIPPDTFNGSTDKNNTIEPTIYPFPAYIKNGEEHWFESDITSGIGIPESKFIDSLLTGFLAVTNSDNILESNINNDSHWFPVGVLDTNIRSSNPSTGPIFDNINPYYKINNTNTVSTLIDTIIKRGFVFLSFTNTMCTEEEIKTMAKIEAKNASDNIINSTVIQLLSRYNHPDIIKYYEDFNKNFTSGSTTLLHYTTDTYSLKEDINLQGSDQTSGRYIPFTNEKYIGGYTFLKIINDGDYGLNTKPQVEGLPNHNGDLILIDEPYSFKHSTKNTTYDIFNTTLGIQEFFNVKTSENSDSVSSDLLFWNGVSIRNGFGYNAGNNGITTYEITKYFNNSSYIIDKPYIGFNTKKYVYAGLGTTYIQVQFHSLFGSELYFRQSDNLFMLGYTDSKEGYVNGIDITNRSKAILFLHTLPLEGLETKDGGLFYNNVDINPFANSDKTFRELLFEKRGGFLKVPDAWLCLIGGLLWRYKVVNKGLLKRDPIIFGDTTNCFIPNHENKGLPQYYQYLKSTSNTSGLIPKFDSFHEPMRFSSGLDDTYTNIEPVLLNLPIQAMDELINYFIDFVNDYFINNIKPIYEIDSVDDTIGQADYNLAKITRTNTFNTVITNTSSLSNVNDITNTTKGLLTEANTLALNLCQEIRPDNDNLNNYNIRYITQSNDIMNIIYKLITRKIVGNSTWRIWAGYNLNKNLEVFNDVLIETLTAGLGWILWNKTYPEGATKFQFPNFIVAQRDLNLYLQTFLTEFKTLEAAKTKINKTQALQNQTFGTMDSDVIKLNLYRTVKAIYDKWVAGTDLNNTFLSDCACKADQSLFDSFRFLDKGFQDIGDTFIINPESILNNLKNNTNQSFYDFSTQILSSNNIDFIPLPSYIDFKNQDQVNKIFTPIPYKQFVSNSEFSVGPTFVCMYVGQPSKHLDDNKDDYPDDSVQLDITQNLPKEFTSDSKYAVPIFQVNYASGNQHIFKDIQLDQSQFSETDESLHIIDNISLQGSTLNRTPIGQNLFNVYSVRAYQATIEAMGNAMIQPMMYFQLNNIPMFKGGYVILNVSHKIKPNHMYTTFKGVRINKVYSPLITETDLFMNLIGGITDVDISGTTITIEQQTPATYQTLNINDSDISKANSSKNKDGSDFKSSYDITGMFSGNKATQFANLGKNRYKTLMIANEGYITEAYESLECKNMALTNPNYAYSYGIGHKDNSFGKIYTNTNPKTRGIKVSLGPNPNIIVDVAFNNDSLSRKDGIDKTLKSLGVTKISENLYYAILSRTFAVSGDKQVKNLILKVFNDQITKDKDNNNVANNNTLILTTAVIDYWLSNNIGANTDYTSGLQIRRKREINFALTGNIT